MRGRGSGRREGAASTVERRVVLLLDRAFVVSCPQPAGNNTDGVVFRERGNHRCQITGAGSQHRRHSADPPALGEPTEQAQLLRHRREQVGRVHQWGDYRPPNPAVDQRSDEDVGALGRERSGRWWVGHLDPAVLGFLARRVCPIESGRFAPCAAAALCGRDS